MTSRILPVAEWSKLKSEQWPLMDQLPQDVITLVVVEDGDQIVGCWGLITIAHAEGMWIHPAHRSKGVVLRRLWRAFSDLVRSRGATSVITGSSNDAITALLWRVGAQPLPPQFSLPLHRKG